MVNRVFNSILPGLIRQSVLNAATSLLEQDMGRPLTEQEREWLQEIADRPRYASGGLVGAGRAGLVGEEGCTSYAPLRSSWEIGAQVSDRRHRAAPDGMVP
jgi:hypothetical protein